MPNKTILTLALLVPFAGCLAGDSEPELAVECSGKCDGLSAIKSLWRDPKAIDLGGLLAVGAAVATDELNRSISLSDWGSISERNTAPVLYALPERTKDDLTLHNISELVSGLLARFGERELTTRVNQV